MSFISKGEKERIAEIDRTLESTASLLSTMRVIRSLGAQPGRFQDILADLYVPNVRKGSAGTRLVTPRKYINDTSIAVFALGPDESVQANRNMTTLHASQAAVLQNFANSNERPELRDAVVSEAAALLDEAFPDIPPVLLDESEEGVRAKTVTSNIELPIGTLPYIVKGRPAVYLPRTATSTPRAIGLTLFHQLVHVDQVLTQDPIMSVQARSAHQINEEEARNLESYVAQASLPQIMRR